MAGKINRERLVNSKFDEKQLYELELPLTFVFPIALFFNDGEIVLFWASSEEDLAMWKNVFQKLLSPHQPK